MTHSRREELRKVIQTEYDRQARFGMSPSFEDLAIVLEDKVILKSELLSVEEIKKVIVKYIENKSPEPPPKGVTEFEYYYSGLAQQIHDRQETP